MIYKIALDGPSGAGKSTMAKQTAQKLGILYVDTGAMYRTVGLYMKNHGIEKDDENAVTAALSSVHLDIRFENGEQHIYLDGEDVGNRIRTPEISMYASRVSAIPAVRAFLLDAQRSLAQKTSVIMDGRDIGTVIFPDADVKIFLTASAEARAMRRVRELEEKGMPTSYEEVLRDMIERDKNDRERTIAPAVAAEDAVILDNSELSAEETLCAILKIIQDKLAAKVGN